jgi:hypothetical protein
VSAQTWLVYGAGQSASRTTGPHHFHRRLTVNAKTCNVCAAPTKIVTPIAAGAVASVPPALLDPTRPPPTETIVFHTQGGDHGALRSYSGTSGGAVGVQGCGRTAANSQRTGRGDGAAKSAGCSLRNLIGGGITVEDLSGGGASVAASPLSFLSVRSAMGRPSGDHSRLVRDLGEPGGRERGSPGKHLSQRRQDKSADCGRAHVVGWLRVFAGFARARCWRIAWFPEGFQRFERHPGRSDPLVVP